MTCQFVNPAPCACAHLLMWILVATATWRPSCAFDFFNGRHFSPGKAHPGNIPNMHRFSSGNWQPSSFWWRSRRSAAPQGFQHPPLSMPLPLSSLPVFRESSQFDKEDPAPLLLPQDNEVLPLVMDEEDDRHSKQLLLRKLGLESDEDDFGPPDVNFGHSVTAMSKPALSPSKLLMKMKLLNEIKQALRRRDKNEVAERRMERWTALNSPGLAYKAAHKLQKMHDLDEGQAMVRQQKTIKSRRAKMGLHTQGAHTAHKLPSHDFPAVEWFPSPPQERPRQSSPTFEEFVLPDSKNNAFHDGPVGSFGSPPSSDSFPMFPEDAPLSGGFSDVPLREFKGGSMMEPSSFSTSFSAAGTEPRPLKQEDEMIVGFWEGGFEDGDKDCDTISTKTCFSDADCSCHGFYECAQGRCDIKENKKAPSHDTWHDEPIDFGFLKRQADDDKMADIENSKGDTKH